MKHSVSAFGFPSALKGCHTISSSVLSLPRTGPAWCFCLLRVVVLSSQVLSTCRHVRLLLFSEARLPPWLAGASSEEQVTHPVCVVPETCLWIWLCLRFAWPGLLVFASPLELGSWQGLSVLSTDTVFVALGKLSELFSVIINSQMHLVTTTYSTCFFWCVFFVHRLIKKSLMLLGGVCVTK